MALLWLAPAWLLAGRSTPVGTFVAVGVLFGMLPDVDLPLKTVVGTIEHHGVLHTVLFVTVAAAVLGPVLSLAYRRVADTVDESSKPAEWPGFAFWFLVVWIPGLSHLFADMLSAPDVAQAVEPFWPLYSQSLGIDLVWYDDPWFNWGLLLAGVLLNAGLWWRRSRQAALTPSKRWD